MRSLRGTGMVVITGILLLAGCSHPLWQAHRFNEEGIGKYENKAFPPARTAFEKSISYNMKTEIPRYNLAGVYFAERNFPLAHRHYAMALEAEPLFSEALYNDGHALFSWGRGELDKDFCSIERTLELWKQAGGRFAEVMKLAGAGSVLGTQSELNLDSIHRQTEMVKAKHEENREKCRNRGGGRAGKKPEKKDPEDGSGKAGAGGKQEGRGAPEKGVTKEGPGKNLKGAAGAGGGGERSEGDLADGSEDGGEIGRALRRIKDESGKNRFNQTRPQQVRKGKGRENVGEKISW